MVKHQRVLLYNELLASGANIVVTTDKKHFYFVDAAGVALTGLLSIRGMQLLSEVTPVTQVLKGVAFGLSTTLAVNTRYSIQIENPSMTYFSHRAATRSYPGTTPLTGNQGALASALYSDLLRKIQLDTQSMVNGYIVYKVTVAHNAAASLTADAAVSQAGEAGFSGKLLKGELINGTSTFYIYNVTGTLNGAKAVTIGGVTTSGTTPAIEAAGIYCVDRFDYNSFVSPNKAGLVPSTFISGNLSKETIKEGVISVGQGADLVRDSQIFVPGNLDLMYGKEEYHFTSAPSASKTYNIYSISVNADMPTGELGDGAMPNIQSVYLIYVDTSDGTKLAAFKARLSESALSA